MVKWHGKAHFRHRFGRSVTARREEAAILRHAVLDVVVHAGDKGRLVLQNSMASRRRARAASRARPAPAGCRRRRAKSSRNRARARSHAAMDRTARPEVLPVAHDGGMFERRSLERTVDRRVVDDQDAVHGAGLPQHRLYDLVDDVGVVEGVDVRQDTHRSSTVPRCCRSARARCREGMPGSGARA